MSSSGFIIYILDPLWWKEYSTSLLSNRTHTCGSWEYEIMNSVIEGMHSKLYLSSIRWHWNSHTWPVATLSHMITAFK